ncbi:MAG: peptidoglycan DD-metalloendopeptidase family protein [candidate division WOR-3 bacterium]
MPESGQAKGIKGKIKTSPQFPIEPKSKLKRGLVALIGLVILSVFGLLILKTSHPKVVKREKKAKRIVATYVLRKNELLPDLLIRCGLSNLLVKGIISALRNSQFDFRRLKAGDTIRFITEMIEDDSINYQRLRKIEYQTSYDRIYEVNFDSIATLATPNPRKISVAMAYKEFVIKTELVRGEISSSLYESLLKIGERADLAFNFADIFGWEIDFFVETQAGDSFFILVEKKFDEDRLVDYGRISLVRYKGKVGDFYGVFFEDPKGHKDYYDLEGKSLRKAFLRSPLRYSRISSYFSGARLHPILRIVRPHRGVDYVAPQGTPVFAIGAGTITFVGWRGGYGRLVEIAHSNGYKSRYGHLAGFGPGICIGRHVQQGQKIGYVGATGLATGPHLHFELLYHNRWVNPLRIIPPRAEPVPKAYLEIFYSIRDQLLAALGEKEIL